MTAEARFVGAGVQMDRQAIVYEARYAAIGIPYTPLVIPPNWNYLASTAATYWHTRDRQTGWLNTYPIDGWMTNTKDPVMRQYFIAGNLPAYGRYGGVLRGGQCKYFANYVLYRAGVSGTGSSSVDPLPSYPTMWKSGKSSSYAKPGDVLFKYSTTKANYNHTAIVTRILQGSSSAGTVSSVEVVDSNYVGNEAIGTHVFSGSALTPYKVWTGAPYFNYNY